MEKKLAENCQRCQNLSHHVILCRHTKQLVCLIKRAWYNNPARNRRCIKNCRHYMIVGAYEEKLTSKMDNERTLPRYCWRCIKICRYYLIVGAYEKNSFCKWTTNVLATALLLMLHKDLFVGITWLLAPTKKLTSKMENECTPPALDSKKRLVKMMSASFRKRLGTHTWQTSQLITWWEIFTCFQPFLRMM